MNAKAIIPLVAGLGIAGLAAKLGLDFIKKAEGKQTQMVKLWTPIEDVKRGVAITDSMLQPLAFPVNAAPKSALVDKEKILGRVPHTGAPAGLPILDSMLLPPGIMPGVRVPPGYRAVAVKIDESSGVDNHLEPGCRVDVVGVFSVNRSNRKETIARTILEDVEVAAVGQRIAPTKPVSADDTSKGKPKRERPPSAVTLLVKPDQVPTLHLAEQKGKIKLSMRGVLGGLDDSDTASVNVNEQDLLGLTEKNEEAEQEKSWKDQFDEFVSSLWQKDESSQETTPISEPAPEIQPKQPSLAWTLVVWNGDERQEWGFRNLNDFQPILISENAPNIFQDEPKYPPLNPPINKTKSDNQNPPGNGDGGDLPWRPKNPTEGREDDINNDQEPEELFG